MTTLTDPTTKAERAARRWGGSFVTPILAIVGVLAAQAGILLAGSRLRMVTACSGGSTLPRACHVPVSAFAPEVIAGVAVTLLIVAIAVFWRTTLSSWAVRILAIATVVLVLLGQIQGQSVAA